MHHAIRDQEIQHEEDESEPVVVDEKTGLHVSNSYYDFENMERSNDVVEEFKVVREINGVTLIRSTLEGKCCSAVDNLLGMFSLGVVILGIVAASSEPTIT